MTTMVGTLGGILLVNSLSAARHALTAGSAHQDTLYYLYDKVPLSGFVIFDDVMSQVWRARGRRRS